MTGPPVEIRVVDGGPALVRGATVISDEQGEHEVTRPVVAVCLCGRSQRRPWCDGTHKSGQRGVQARRQVDAGRAVTPPEDDGSVPIPKTCRFGPLWIGYDERILEPRDWTVAQAQWAAQLAADAPTGPLLEVCAGAGQIGLLAARLTGHAAVLVDADELAAAWARANATMIGGLVEVRHGPMDEVVAAEEVFPLIIADPPWVPSAQTDRFPADPRFAIDGGDDGLRIAVSCLALAGRHLAPGGSAIVQLGSGRQADSLAAAAAAHGLVEAGRRAFDRGLLIHLQRGCDAPAPDGAAGPGPSD